MQLPVITPDLILRIERIWAAFWSAHLAGLSKLPGNPLGVTIAHANEAVALRAPGAAADPWLNRMLCLTDRDAGHLPQLLRDYREQGVEAHLEVAPGLAGPDLLAALADQGCRQVGWHAVTYGLPAADVDEPSSDLMVSEVGEADREIFLRTLLQGFGAPDDAPLDGLRHWCEIPGVRLYLARSQGEPAGAAVLYVKDGIGYMANASTRPEMRGRGCQTALLKRRIAAAADLDCDLITAMAAFGSVSQHNMERVGLRVAYTKAVWRDQAH